MSNENHSIRKEEISNPNLNLKKLEKEEQIKPKANERKEINIRAETNETERRKTIEKINKTKSCFFEIINKIDKWLPRLKNKKGKMTQITNTRNGRGNTTTEVAENRGKRML